MQLGQSLQPKGRTTVPKPPVMIGPCFSCEDTGHLKWSCPKLAPEVPRWYPFNLEKTAEESRRDIAVERSICAKVAVKCDSVIKVYTVVKKV